MPAHTPLGLTKLFPNEPLSVDGYSFANRNIDIIDRTLRLLMEHRHDGMGEAFPTPGAPDVTETAVEGRLRPGVTYYYRVAELSDDGELESPPGPSSWVTISGGLSAPPVTVDDVTVEAEGGALQPGVYQYAFTVYGEFHTYDTDCPAPVTVNLSPMDGDEQQVSFTLPDLPAGASGWNVYRRSPGSAGFHLLETFVGDPGSFVDDGFSSEQNRKLPTTNLSAWNRSATVVRPDDVTGRWVVYRSTNDSDWTASRLRSVSSSTDAFLDDGTGTSWESPYGGNVTYSNPDQLTPDQVGSVLHVASFRSEGPAQPGPFGEWVSPAIGSVAGLTAFLDAGSVPSTQDLMVKLERWDDGLSTWSDAGVDVVVPANQSWGASPGSLTPLGVDVAHGDRLRLNVTQVGDGSDEGLCVHIQLWLQRSASWAPPGVTP